MCSGERCKVSPRSYSGARGKCGSTYQRQLTPLSAIVKHFDLLGAGNDCVSASEIVNNPLGPPRDILYAYNFLGPDGRKGEMGMGTALPFAGYRWAGRLAACTLWLFGWAATVILVTVAPGSEAQDAAGQTRFQRTMQYLQDASPELRGAFAATALRNLQEAYVTEADLARKETGAAGRAANLGGWSATVDYFARQVPLLLDDIALGLPVRLAIGGEQSLTVTVSDRTIIVSHPRLSQQGAFEEAILAEFCAQQSCEQFLPENAAREPLQVATMRVRPDWTFTAQESVCSYSGIKVRFQGRENLSNSRHICEQFLREVIALTDQLALQQRHGVQIAWDDLSVQSTAHGPEHMIQLNAIGDTVLATVPVLSRNPDLLGQVTPWIRQQLDNQTEISIELDANQYGWQEPWHEVSH
jgi:hypothetical protein